MSKYWAVHNNEDEVVYEMPKPEPRYEAERASRVLLLDGNRLFKRSPLTDILAVNRKAIVFHTTTSRLRNPFRQLSLGHRAVTKIRITHLSRLLNRGIRPQR